MKYKCKKRTQHANKLSTECTFAEGELVELIEKGERYAELKSVDYMGVHEGLKTGFVTLDQLNDNFVPVIAPPAPKPWPRRKKEKYKRKQKQAIYGIGYVEGDTTTTADELNKLAAEMLDATGGREGLEVRTGFNFPFEPKAYHWHHEISGKLLCGVYDHMTEFWFASVVKFVNLENGVFADTTLSESERKYLHNKNIYLKEFSKIDQWNYYTKTYKT